MIIVDAVYSMDGDIAPLKEVIELRDWHADTILWWTKPIAWVSLELTGGESKNTLIVPDRSMF